MDCCMYDSDFNTLYTFMPKLNHIKKNLFYPYNFFSTPSLADSICFVAKKKKSCLYDFRLHLYEDTVLDILIIRMLMLLIFLLRINTTFRGLINVISIVANTGHEFCSRG